MELGKSISSYRLHDQGVPNKITYKADYPPETALIERFQKIGHVVESSEGGCVVQAVAKQHVGVIKGMSDPRKYALADGY